MRFEDGNEYEGDWVNNQKHGRGVLNYVNGDKYDGEWRHDQKLGNGNS